MSAKRLLSANQFNPFPPVVRNFLRWSQNTLSQSPTSFTAKGPIVLATNLLRSYFEQGLVVEARKLFDEMPERDVVAWMAMIVGYTSCNEYLRAFCTFRDMLNNGIDPNAYTISSVLKACKGLEDLSFGVVVHGLAIKHGLGGYIYVENALMDMYATYCVSMNDACKVFIGIQDKNAVSWTTLIAGYTHRDQGHQAVQTFRQMLLEDVESNPFSFSIAVRACASIGSLNYGQQIRTAIIKHGFESNLPAMNSILDLYFRCGCLPEANRLFHEMSEKDLITWNTVIAGYEKLDPGKALSIFSVMELKGFTPNCFTFTSVIAACANLAALNCGQQVHGAVFCRGLVANVALANSLIDMYAKCGDITESHKMFSELPYRNLVSWTSMMLGYGAHGFGKEAVELFDEMVRSGFIPDQIVFMAVLSACSHAGLVDQGLRYFSSISEYDIEPNQEVYGCVADLLGRAGRVEEAYHLILNMPFKPSESVWSALLGASKAHRLTDLGKLAAQRVLTLTPNLVEPYVVLSNIYAAEGKWGESARMRKLIRGVGCKKEVGKSWIEVRNQVYSFVAGIKDGHHMELAGGTLKFLIQHVKEAGYALDCLMHDLENET
ncbi:hypothetical protein K2173_003964 [Erythroxylum novogranatense]|uniref:Pentatricopeptide repeat-containing protein n=1 Tax=Erythroxylum novogranatense TaxID=1862640 RepID=A0AAV8SK45_9ROSI|nr:hypothetical protein K2173_003964 [Erythroxylum novogranatense]